MGRKDGKRSKPKQTHSRRESDSKDHNVKTEVPKAQPNSEATKLQDGSQKPSNKKNKMVVEQIRTNLEPNRTKEQSSCTSNISKDAPRKDSNPPKPFSQLGVEEQDLYIEQVIKSLSSSNGEERKGEYIERVISSIGDLLRLEESLGAEILPQAESTEKDGKLRKENPTVEGSKGEPSNPCEVCGTTAKTRCTGCRLVYYCHRECQKMDWKKHKDICRPYAIANSRDTGRILVATRELHTDDSILLEAPLVLGPRPGSGPLCLVCYRRLTTEYRCSKCGLPLCSLECEEGEAHKRMECQVISTAGLKDVFRLLVNVLEVVTPLRCLIGRKKEVQKWRALTEKLDVRFLETVGASDINSELLSRLQQIVKASTISELLPTSVEEIHQVLGLVQVHNIPTKLPHGETQGIYCTASLLSHSCTPNTKLQWDSSSQKLRVTCTETILRRAPITTIYTDILWGTRARREHLQQTRRISCTCRRCKDPSELGTYFSALICPTCPRRNVVLPENPLDNNSIWKCGKCNHQMTASEVLEKTLSLGAAVSEALQSPSIDFLESLQKEWTSRFHSNHYHLLALKHSLLQLYGREQEKAEEKKERHWVEMSRKELACKEFLQVVSLLDPALGNTVMFVGLVFFEYHKTILQSAKRNFGLAKINALQLKKRMLLSKELLKKAMDMFKGEPPDTAEGRLYITCRDETISIGKWMLAVGLV